jgi:hypothetical protein
MIAGSLTGCTLIMVFATCVTFDPGPAVRWRPSDAESVKVYDYTFDVSRYSTEYRLSMREEFGLEALVADAKSDWEKVLAVLAWVRTRWEHDGSAVAKPDDPISILRSAAEGKRYRCVEYAIVVQGCLEALGIPSRKLNLAVREVESTLMGAGHVANEVYLADLDKWFFLDGQWNTIPLGADGIPLNALELRQALDRKDPGLTILDTLGGDPSDYKTWIHPYLYYLSTGIHEGKNHIEKRLILLPEGAPEPKVFQILSPFAPVPRRVTADASEFYRPPL